MHELICMWLDLLFFHLMNLSILGISDAVNGYFMSTHPPILFHSSFSHLFILDIPLSFEWRQHATNPSPFWLAEDSPSVKVPSISMENGGVLERAKMGISIYGEKEWKKQGIDKESGKWWHFVHHLPSFAMTMEYWNISVKNRWQLCHQVPLIFFAIVFQYWWKTVANFPPFAMTVEYWNISLENGGIICHHLPSRLSRHFCHRLPELMENDGNYFHRLPPWWRTVAFDG